MVTHCDPALDPECISDDPTPTPTATATVTETVTATPAPATMGTEADPTIVRMDNESTALLLLTSCLGVGLLGVIATTLFGK